MDVVSRRPNQGWIEVITGSMFSGKSEELIRRVRRAQIARQRVQVFKPEFDDRYGDDHIVSHSDIRMPVTSSVTPLIVENSWATPSIRTLVTAAPASEDRSTRRSELPKV